MKRSRTIVEKPNFIKALGYYSIRFGAVFLTIVTICYYFSGFYYRNEGIRVADTACDKVFSQAVEYTRYYYNGTQTNTKKHEIRYALLNLWEDYSICSSIGIDDSFIASSEDCLALFCSMQKAEAVFFDDEVDGNRKLTELLLRLEIMGIDYRNCEYLADTAYVLWISRIFRPGQIRVVNPDTDEVILETDLSEDSGLSNEISATRYSYSYPMNMKFMGNPDCDVHEFYKYITVINITENTRWISTQLYGSLWDSQELNPHDHIIESEETLNDSGESVTLTMRSDYSYLLKIYSDKANDFTKQVAFNLFLVFAIVSMVAAIIMYYKQKSIYELFEYRRQTTDAMAHDLKTPLAIASAYVENLKEDISEDKKDQYLASIDESIKYMNRLINDILDFSHSQYQNERIYTEKVDVRESFVQLAEMLSPACNLRQLKISIEGEKILMTDRKMLEQSLLNLLSNAVKYASSDSDINVVIGKHSITIQNRADHDIKNLDRLLEPYVKGDTYRGENTGSGLGLAIANNNLMKLGFKLTVNYTDKIFTAIIHL